MIHQQVLPLPPHPYPLPLLTPHLLQPFYLHLQLLNVIIQLYDLINILLLLLLKPALHLPHYLLILLLLSLDSFDNQLELVALALDL